MRSLPSLRSLEPPAGAIEWIRERFGRIRLDSGLTQDRHVPRETWAALHGEPGTQSDAQHMARCQERGDPAHVPLVRIEHLKSGASGSRIGGASPKLIFGGLGQVYFAWGASEGESAK